MSVTVELTEREIQLAINAPKIYVAIVLKKLFKVPHTPPMVDKIIFNDVPFSPTGHYKVSKNPTTIYIDTYLKDGLTKEKLLAYITKASKSVVDLSVWKDSEFPEEPKVPVEPEEVNPPEETTVPPEEPETIEPPEEDDQSTDETESSTDDLETDEDSEENSEQA